MKKKLAGRANHYKKCNVVNLLKNQTNRTKNTIELSVQLVESQTQKTRFIVFSCVLVAYSVDSFEILPILKQKARQFIST